MKKILATALAGGLVLGALVAPAAAKKKKKPKAPVPVASEVKYFLRWDGDGTTCDAQYLSIEDAEDGGSGCESIGLPAQEVLIATGQGALTHEWPAQDGLPFVLDATRKITGEITMRGLVGANSKVEVVVSGEVDGEVKEIASGETQAQNFAVTGQTGPQVLKFEIAPDAALNGKTVQSLLLTTTTRGVNVLTYFDLENPPSFMTVPTTTYQ